jgi:PAS domain S-box-containing protein
VGNASRPDGPEVTVAGSEVASAPLADALRLAQRAGRVRKSEVALILGIDAGGTAILGWQSEDFVGRNSLDFIHPADQELAVENWMQMLGSSGPGRAIRLRHKHRDGSWVWVELTNHNHLDDPAHNCIVAEVVDISEEMASHVASEKRERSSPLRLHEALGAREQVLHRLAEALPLGVIQIEAQGRIVYTNQRLHAILGAPRADTVEEQLSTVASEDRELVADAFDAVLRSGLDMDIEVRVAGADGDGGKELRLCIGP